MTIDIFCNVIDNFGDIGVVYRLSKELHGKGHSVRIFVNKLQEVSKLIENFDPHSNYQWLNGICFINLDNFSINNGSEVIIEAFGTDLPESYIESLDKSSKLIINLEYLTAEKWALDFHLKKSISPKDFIEKYFYMPGFHENSGGIVLDEKYLELVEEIKSNREEFFNDFYKKLNLSFRPDVFYINIFTYNWNFNTFIENLKNSSKQFIFFILDKRFELPKTIPSNIEIYELPHMKQEDFDIFINLSDFNFIRGEESIIRAILSEKPFIWNIYPQEDDYHLEKLEAFFQFYSDFDENFEEFRRLNFEFNRDEDFSDTFLRFIEKTTETFKIEKEFLITNCDLVTKLLNFIDSKLKN